MPLSPHSARSSSSIGRHPDRAGNWTRTPFLYLYISPPLSRCPPWLCSSVGTLGPANSWWQDSGCLSWRSRLHHPFLDSKATLGEGWGVCRVFELASAFYKCWWKCSERKSPVDRFLIGLATSNSLLITIMLLLFVYAPIIYVIDQNIFPHITDDLVQQQQCIKLSVSINQQLKWTIIILDHAFILGCFVSTWFYGTPDSQSEKIIEPCPDRRRLQIMCRLRYVPADCDLCLERLMSEKKYVYILIVQFNYLIWQIKKVKKNNIVWSTLTLHGFLEIIKCFRLMGLYVH